MTSKINNNTLIVSFRGTTITIDLTPDITVEELKQRVASHDGNNKLTGEDVNLLYRGKKLSSHNENDEQPLLLINVLKPSKNPHRMIATGVSKKEKETMNSEMKEGMNKHRIRDDLTEQGKREMAQRQRLGRTMMARANKRQQQQQGNYGFGSIQVLPNLPNQDKARQILTELSQDPGILACMAKHNWHVPILKELYPEGKVGESAVCVMGLNKNKGQEILLRIRTDDLQGFRKPLSIRKVLYHELAHNVYSDHDQDFFRLMRQIEKECNELDWTQGQGLETTTIDDEGNDYQGGSYRLGGATPSHVPLRELVARAAMLRLTAEEEEISEACGCGISSRALFLPPNNNNDKSKE